jgi:hypothetical protein
MPYTGHPEITGLSAITPRIVISRTSGKVPAVVQVSACLTTMTGASDPYHLLEYSWDFGDTSGTETLSNPAADDDGTTHPTVNANVDQIGPEAEYLYRTAGTYTITLTARGWNGTEYISASTSTLMALEVIQLSIKGSPTGGTFTLTRPSNGNTTAAINRTDTIAQVQAKLEANGGTTIYGTGNVEVLGSDAGLQSSGPSGVLSIRLIGSLAGTTESVPTVGTNSLTGGTSPAPLINRVKVGSTLSGGSALFTASARGGSEMWFDSVSGSDANNGLSSGAPKQTASALESFYEGGNDRTAWVKRGSSWSFASSNLRCEDGVSGRAMLAYGAGARPQLTFSSSGDGGIKLEVGYGNSVEDIVFDGIDVNVGASHTHGIFLTSSGNGTNTNPYGVAHDVYFLDCKVRGGNDVRMHVQTYYTGRGIGTWRCEFDGESYTGQEELVSVERWCCHHGNSYVNGDGSDLDHHVYPNVSRHDSYRWCSFGESNPVTEQGKRFCINGNVMKVSDGGQDHRYMLVDSCDLSGMENGIDLSSTHNAPADGQFLDVIIQRSAIHLDPDKGTQHHAIYTTCLQRLTVRDCRFYGNEGFDLVMSDPETDLDFYRNKVWKPADATVCAIRLGGIAAAAPAATDLLDNTFVSLITTGLGYGILNYEADELSGVTASGNQYYAPTLTTSAAFYESDAATTKSFAQWQALGLDADGSYADPGWADPAAGDFTVASVPPPRVLVVRAAGLRLRIAFQAA